MGRAERCARAGIGKGDSAAARVHTEGERKLGRIPSEVERVELDGEEGSFYLWVWLLPFCALDVRDMRIGKDEAVRRHV